MGSCHIKDFYSSLTVLIKSKVKKRNVKKSRVADMMMVKVVTVAVSLISD